MTSQPTEPLEKILEGLGLTHAEAKFIEEQNPMHYRNRLLDLGFKEQEATEISHWYAEYVYTPVMEIYKWRKEQGGNNNGI
jgi:hypothetical protein